MSWHTANMALRQTVAGRSRGRRPRPQPRKRPSAKRVTAPDSSFDASCLVPSRIHGGAGRNPARRRVLERLAVGRGVVILGIVTGRRGRSVDPQTHPPGIMMSTASRSVISTFAHSRFLLVLLWRTAFSLESRRRMLGFDVMPHALKMRYYGYGGETRSGMRPQHHVSLLRHRHRVYRSARGARA